MVGPAVNAIRAGCDKKVSTKRGSPIRFDTLCQLRRSPATAGRNHAKYFRANERRAANRCRDGSEFEIEYRDTRERLAFVIAMLARADHQPLLGRLVATEVNHGLRDLRFLARSGRVRPKQKVSRFQSLELERVVTVTKHGLKVTGLAHPGVLFTGVTRDILLTRFRKHVPNETGAIHSALCRIG